MMKKLAFVGSALAFSTQAFAYQTTYQESCSNGDQRAKYEYELTCQPVGSDEITSNQTVTIDQVVVYKARQGETKAEVNLADYSLIAKTIFDDRNYVGSFQVVSHAGHAGVLFDDLVLCKATF